MAQLWLTYEEMAQSFGGSAEGARAGAIENGWARIKGRDGVTHVRLPDPLSDQYLQSLVVRAAAESGETDAMVSSLRALVHSARRDGPVIGVARAA